MSPGPRPASVYNSLVLMLFTAPFEAGVAASERESGPSNAPAYDFEAVYTSDLWRNARGGLSTGGVYLDNLDLALGVEGERAWGLPGVSAFAYVLYNNAASLSGDYVGDAMTASNIDAPQAWRLYEAWVQWESASTHGFSMRLGLYDMNSEFDVLDSRSLFIHSSHGVGHELAQTGENGPSIFPVTSLALRVAFSPSPDFRVLTAVFDGVPGDPQRPSSNRLRLSQDEGALAMVELQWMSERITKLAVGHWRFTAEFDDLRSSAATPRPPRDHNRGTYGAVEVALDRNMSSDPATLAFVRYGVADERINEFADSWGVGLRRRGLFAARPDDEFGVAYARTHLSAAARRAALFDGAPRERYEAALELTYRAALTDWLTVQPDVQFIFNPGADRSLEDSLVFGLRLEFSAAQQW